MKRRRSVIARLLLVLCLGAVSTSATAWSQPEPPPDGPAALTLALTALGGQPGVQFQGSRSETAVNFAVSPGLEPVSLSAVTQLPVNVRSATIEVLQEDRPISRAEVPPGPPVPIVMPLAGIRIQDRAASLTLRAVMLPVEGTCLDPATTLQLADPSVAFAGGEAVPTSVADFLPPVLRQITIFVDDDPSQVESDAAVRLAATVALRYSTQYPDVSVVALPAGALNPPGPSGPLQRYIVVREDPSSGVSIIDNAGVPALLVAGPGQELTNQSRLLASDIGALALAPKAVAGAVDSPSRPPGDQITFTRVGQTGLNATGLAPQVNIGVDQTRLARSVHSVRVHLLGSYTPLPADIGGQLIASIAGETVDRWPADGTGEIDRWVDIPDDLLTRYSNVQLRMDITGDTGGCDQFEPLTLTVDGDSTINSSAARQPVPAGFQSLPQALMPRTLVGIDGGFDNLRRAVGLVVGLQRLSATPMDTTVLPLADAIAGAEPAVLVSPEGWEQQTLALPVSADDAGEVTVTRPADPGGSEEQGEQTTLRLEPALGFGSVQTVFDGRRSVLVATSNNAPVELDAVLGWLAQEPERWANLEGAAVVGVPGQTPVVVEADTVEPEGAAAPPQVSQSTGLPMWVWATVGAAALFGVLVVAAIMLRNRRTARPS